MRGRPGTDPCELDEICVEAEDRCVECEDDDDCDVDETCDVAAGVCEADEPECVTNEDCEEGEICNAQGECEAAAAAELNIDKCKIKAGKTDKTDQMQFSGALNVTEGELAAATEAVVTVETAGTPDLAVFTFDVAAENIKKGKYKSPKVKPADKSDPQSALQIDSNKGTIKFKGKNLDLTGLACPFTVIVEIGTYMAEQELDSDIVNGKKECPAL